jgi:glycosyltransferase involved in cell wall biosynthesis
MNSPGTGMFKHLSRLGLKTLVKPMRRWDYKAAQRPDFIIANSTHTKQEIRKYYDRTATVIYPPVAIERFRARASNTKRRGFIVSGRQTPYKRFDLAVIACTKLGLPLTVIGDGPEHRHLRKLAGKTVTFLGAVSDPVLEEEFASAKAMLFPQVEDFGITGVEALAAGTPVIAYRGGGAADYVVPGETGVLFDEQTVSGLARGLREFSKMSFNGTELSRRAERFSRQQFRRSMRAYIKRALQETKHNTSAA